VSSNGATVDYVGVGTCTLIPAVASTANYSAATGPAQSFNIGLATPTVSITNMPASIKRGGSFTPTFSTSGNGTVFTVTSTTPAICTVVGATVNFINTGTCSLTVSVAATADYMLATSAATTLSTSAAKAPSTLDLGRVYFAFNQSGVNSVKSRTTIENAARVIKAHQYVAITVMAYADDAGTRSYNLALSERRAVSVVALLKRDLVAVHDTRAVVRGTGKGVSTASAVATLDRVAIMVVVR
jgi:outer membrane protein OmpA-like peptidoglycan-associated protein